MPQKENSEGIQKKIMCQLEIVYKETRGVSEYMIRNSKKRREYQENCTYTSKYTINSVGDKPKEGLASTVDHFEPFG